MLKNISKLEVKIGEKLYHFLCDCDSPLGEVHDALAKMKSFVVSTIVEQEKKEGDQKKSQESDEPQCKSCS